MDDAELRRVDVIVVTYNSADVVAGLLSTLADGLDGVDWRLIVADNNSGDDTVELVRACSRAAEVIPMRENRGYAAGINAALAIRRPAADVLLLNPDVRLGAHATSAMLRALAEPGTGVVVPLLIGTDGRHIHSLRRDPTVLRALGDAALGVERAGHYARLGETVTDPDGYGLPSTVDWATGCAMLLSRSCIENCGSWDESFFLYSEEIEFCQRARRKGFTVRFCPDAVATHLEGDSKVSPLLWALLVSNRVRLYRRTHGAFASATFWLVNVLRETSRAMLGRTTSRRAVASLVNPRHAAGNVPALAARPAPGRQAEIN